MPVTRALEAYWAGLTAWCLDETDRPARRHADVVGRIRGRVLELGEHLVALRHGASVGEVLHALDRLAWLLGIAEQRGALTATQLARLADGMQCVRGMLPAPGGAVAPGPMAQTSTTTAEDPC